MDISLPLPFLGTASLLAYALSMAVSVYYFNRRSPVNRWFAAFLALFTAWGATGLVYMYLPVKASAWVAAQMACGILLGPVFWFFSRRLVDEAGKFKKVEILLLLPSAWVLSVSLARILVPRAAASFAAALSVSGNKLSRETDATYIVYTLGIFGEVVAALALIARGFRRPLEIQDRRRNATIFIAMIAVAGTLFAFTSLANILGRELDPVLSTAACVIGVTFISLSLMRNKAWTIERLLDLVKKREAELEVEKGKSDALLLNILPSSIAQELKERGRVAPLSYESASVLFTDFYSFSLVTELMGAEELVAELDRHFSAFERIVERNRMEKLKTIGDSFMCAGGIPRPNGTHAVDAILAALQMRDFMEESRRSSSSTGRPTWSLRLGIHSGPLVAGVIGSRKMAYDIWGDTVNTASRMESSGQSGRVNVSERTMLLARDFFVFQSRGEILVKNKGMVPMYFVEGIRPELSEEGRGLVPNEAFMRLYGSLEAAFAACVREPPGDSIAP